MAMKDINDSKKWEAFAARLVEMTTSGDLEWDEVDHFGRPNSISPLYMAKHKDWYVLIFRHEYRYYHDEERYDLSEEVSIELVDYGGTTRWTLPKVPSRHRLLDHIQFQEANVESLLNDILQDDEDS